jgi:UDP-galactose transporter
MIDRAALLGGVPMKALSLVMVCGKTVVKADRRLTVVCSLRSRIQPSSWYALPAPPVALRVRNRRADVAQIMHYSRIMPLVNGQRYFTSTSVFLNEVIKLTISATVALYDLSKNMPPNTPATAMVSELVSSMFAGDSWKLAVPAALYTLQNSLQYVAVSNLDPSTFQVTYQLKILTTAIFSVLMLGRTLTVKKWASLGLLMLGVAIVQLPQSTSEVTVEDTKTEEPKIGRRAVQAVGTYVVNSIVARSGSYQGIQEDKPLDHPDMNRSVGLMAVLIACALSGLAGVCFEKVLKQSPPTQKPVSLWVRNCQLSFWSLFPAFFIGVLWVDGANLAKAGFFAGYNFVVWTAILFQAGGGIIVALVINYADNIAKNFATSISIIISALASAYFFDFQITIAVGYSLCRETRVIADKMVVLGRNFGCHGCYLSVQST